MNRVEYAAFEEAFADFMRREGINCLSRNPEMYGEPHFSWRPCDCCKSHLGGDRYYARGFNPNTREVQDGYQVCPDCYYYAAYGTLDDESMPSIDTDGEMPEQFLAGFIRATLFSETDDDDGEPLDRRFGAGDFPAEVEKDMRRECETFWEANHADLALMDPHRAGCCFYWNRNRHGTGFWDEDSLPDEATRERLSAAAVAAGDTTHHLALPCYHR